MALSLSLSLPSLFFSLRLLTPALYFYPSAFTNFSLLAAGQDYEHLSENFTIQGGESKCYNVAIVDDTLPEATERIRLLLNSSNNALRHQFVTELTIVDDDGMT